MQLFIAAIPGPRLIHYQQHLAPGRIKSKKIDHARIGYAVRYQSLVTHKHRLGHSEQLPLLFRAKSRNLYFLAE